MKGVMQALLGVFALSNGWQLSYDLTGAACASIFQDFGI
jgi:hypothetical protein